MNMAHRMWWRALMDLRPIIRFLAERFPKLAPVAVRLRTLAHVTVGNPVQTILLAIALRLWAEHLVSFRVVGGVAALLFVSLEIWHRRGFETGAGGWSVGWRESWRLRRRWPAGWAEQAAKTRAIQAEVGTSKEPVASAALRPVADHPKMGCWPTVNWPQVSWWVGPPPGRTFAQFDEVLDVLATNNPRVVGYELDYDRITDSFARLTVSFRSVLDEAIAPVETTVDSEPWTPVVIEGGLSGISNLVTIGDLPAGTDVDDDEFGEVS